MRFGRWLLATAPGALDRYDTAYNRWACALLHSPPWRSAAIAHMELGCGLCGRHRARLDIAGRRARLWTLPQGDIYGEIFIQSHAVQLSWARRSLALFDIPDYPDARGLRVCQVVPRACSLAAVVCRLCCALVVLLWSPGSFPLLPAVVWSLSSSCCPPLGLAALGSSHGAPASVSAESGHA